jgi:hypothetical protein
MRKLPLWTLILIFGFTTILGCGASKKAGGTIVGKVNNTFHGGGVDGAKVSLSSNGSEFTTTTDKSGNFTFSGLSPGTYAIEVTKDGFFDGEARRIKVQDGKETKVEIGLIVAFGGT